VVSQTYKGFVMQIPDAGDGVDKVGIYNAAGQFVGVQADAVSAQKAIDQGLYSSVIRSDNGALERQRLLREAGGSLTPELMRSPAWRATYGSPAGGGGSVGGSGEASAVPAGGVPTGTSGAGSPGGMSPAVPATPAPNPGIGVGSGGGSSQMSVGGGLGGSSGALGSGPALGTGSDEGIVSGFRRGRDYMRGDCMDDRAVFSGGNVDRVNNFKLLESGSYTATVMSSVGGVVDAVDISGACEVGRLCQIASACGYTHRDLMEGRSFAGRGAGDLVKFLASSAYFNVEDAPQIERRARVSVLSGRDVDVVLGSFGMANPAGVFNRLPVLEVTL